MAPTTPDEIKEKDQMVTDSFYIPKAYQARLEAIAAADDANKSQVLRRILRDYFGRIDAAALLPDPATVA